MRADAGEEAAKCYAQDRPHKAAAWMPHLMNQCELRRRARSSQGKGSSICHTTKEWKRTTAALASTRTPLRQRKSRGGGGDSRGDGGWGDPG